MPPAIAEFAPAKINLALAVTGRRRDGYHLIDTLAVFAGIGDHLEVAPAADLSLEIVGPFAGSLSDPSTNLVLCAALLLRDAAFGSETPGVHLRLDKRLPVASGIGGGSADAAAALRALNRLWGVDWSLDRLIDLGVQLGADIPMCLVGRPLRARGIGEDIAALPDFPPLHLVLVNPGVAVATADVFSALTGRFSRSLPDPAGLSDVDAAVAWLGETANDLEAPALRLAPTIGAVLDAVRASPGCLLARMSGSGATCFGLYRGQAEAEAAARTLSTAHQDWWVVATTTGAASTSG